MTGAMQKMLSWYRGDKNIAHGCARPGAAVSVGFGLVCDEFPAAEVAFAAFRPRFMPAAASVQHAKRLTSRDLALQSP